jgi:hypothetical protein
MIYRRILQCTVIYRHIPVSDWDMTKYPFLSRVSGFRARFVDFQLKVLSPLGHFWALSCRSVPQAAGLQGHPPGGCHCRMVTGTRAVRVADSESATVTPVTPALRLSRLLSGPGGIWRSRLARVRRGDVSVPIMMRAASSSTVQPVPKAF